METPDEQMKNCQEWLRWNRAKYFYQLLKQDILGSEIRSWAITPNYASTWDEKFNFVLPASVNKKIKEKHDRNFLNIANKTRDNLVTYKLWKGSPFENKKIILYTKGRHWQQFCFMEISVACKMEVTYLLLFYGAFVVLMEGKGQTYTKATSADYAEVRVQVFMAGVPITKPASQANWKVMPSSRLLVHNSFDAMRCTPGKDVCGVLRGQ